MPAKKTPGSDGFTIMETLIVLAVAGLILLLVLIAVPTLQRNSRNNQRKQDVQTILEAISHWELNHSGTIPNPPGDDFLQFTPPRFYAAGNIAVHATVAGGASAPPQTGLDNVDIYNHQKCTGVGTASSRGAGYYDVVAMYAIETSSGVTSRCQEL